MTKEELVAAFEAAIRAAEAELTANGTTLTIQFKCTGGDWKMFGNTIG